VIIQLSVLIDQLTMMIAGVGAIVGKQRCDAKLILALCKPSYPSLWKLEVLRRNAHSRLGKISVPPESITARQVLCEGYPPNIPSTLDSYQFSSRLYAA